MLVDGVQRIVRRPSIHPGFVLGQHGAWRKQITGQKLSFLEQFVPTAGGMPGLEAQPGHCCQGLVAEGAQRRGGWAEHSAEPFTLGVRVKNHGMAAAKGLKIGSAQPRIIAKNQGLLTNFVLAGSYVNDVPRQNTFLIHFGKLAPQSSKMGRWVMQTALAGRFTEFSARFSHADELGGALTSILQATNTHLLIRDVRVDMPGRDHVRDFLARDGDVIRVYESDGPDTVVTERSHVATLMATAGAGANASYRLTFPATAGFVYLRLPDPYNGSKALGRVVRSDAKELLADNIWLSKTRNEQTRQWQHWVNIFDVNTTGVYDSEFQTPPPAARAPVLEPVPDQVTRET